MLKIKTMNAISEHGTGWLLKHGCEVGPDVENPDGMLIRSANLHGMEFGENMIAIARAGAGFNNIPVEECAKKGIVVFNSPGANAEAVKEQEIASLVMASRDMIGAIDWVRSIADCGDEIPDMVEKGKSSFAGPELLGKTLGVIGLGAIGALVANAALDLGMVVYGYDPFMSVDAAWRLSRDVIKAEDVDTIYAKADYISVNVPFTESTKHMIDAAAIEKMKKGAVIVNTSRGGLIDAEALLEGIKARKVGAACLDVYEEESDIFFEDRSGHILNDDLLSRLISMPNVIVTSHQAFLTEEALNNIAETTVNNILSCFVKDGICDNELCYRCGNIERCKKERKEKCF